MIESIKQQKLAHKEWITSEGGIEHPTHIETLQRPEQQARIKWLKEHCHSRTEILDLGCSWGYILNELNGKCGVDINPENIDKAIQSFPDKYFIVGDITKPLPFENEQYAIVILADTLEHILWGKVTNVLKEALRVTRWNLLITLPWRRSNDFSYCFKHEWMPDALHVGLITSQLMLLAREIHLENDGIFVYVDIKK